MIETLEVPAGRMDPSAISQSEIQARIVLASPITTSCNMQTETEADIGDSVCKVLTPVKKSENAPLYRENFVKMLTAYGKNKRDTVITYDYD